MKNSNGSGASATSGKKKKKGKRASGGDQVVQTATTVLALQTVALIKLEMKSVSHPSKCQK